MKTIVETILLTILTFSFSSGSNLTAQYREMMKTTQIEKKVEITSKATIDKELRKKYQKLAAKTVPKNTDGSINMNSKEFKDLMKNYAKERREYKANPQKITKTQKDNYKVNFIDNIKKIQALKQGTFESSAEFNKRRSNAINTLNNKMKPFTRRGSKEYSVGTLSMKHYDADKEEIQLLLQWNKDIQTILPETKKIKTTTLSLPRNQAKKLFAQQDTHNFHIALTYTDDKINISKIIIYDKIIEIKQNEWFDDILSNVFN